MQVQALYRQFKACQVLLAGSKLVYRGFSGMSAYEIGKVFNMYFLPVLDSTGKFSVDLFFHRTSHTTFLVPRECLLLQWNSYNKIAVGTVQEWSTRLFLDNLKAGPLLNRHRV